MRVNVHDFVDPELGRAIPYGIYDKTNNEGWVSVGGIADTAEFAVNAIPFMVPAHRPSTILDRHPIVDHC